MKKTLFSLSFFVLAWVVSAQTQPVDEICFGNPASEKKHGLIVQSSETYQGGLGEPARRLLPVNETDYRGGTLKFVMKVNPAEQNYCTFRLWGSEKDHNYCMLFIEGKPIGYRHLGDFENIYRGNGEAPSLNRFFYSTLALPLQWTKGKKQVALEVRAYGPIWGYGGSFDRFQRPMTEPTVGFYKAYTHVNPAFLPDRKEKQGLMRVAEAPLRPDDGAGIMETLKKRVEEELRRELEQEDPLNQLQVWTLSDAYHVEWTPAYRNPRVVDRVVEAMDRHCVRLWEDPKLLDADRSVYNPDWLLVGPFARALRALWPGVELKRQPAVYQYFTIA